VSRIGGSTPSRSGRKKSARRRSPRSALIATYSERRGRRADYNARRWDFRRYKAARPSIPAPSNALRYRLSKLPSAHAGRDSIVMPVVSSTVPRQEFNDTRNAAKQRNKEAARALNAIWVGLTTPVDLECFAEMVLALRNMSAANASVVKFYICHRART
jgi:hypothetical protein